MKCKVLTTLAAVALGGAALPMNPAHSVVPPAIAMANYLLHQQDVNGAIPDEPGGAIVNEDSNMEYALMGIGAAYSSTHDQKYLSALTRGIRWLGAREELADPIWRGSFRYAYASTPPYLPVQVSPGPGIVDVRGVDATSSLFAHLVALQVDLSNSNALAVELSAHVHAALGFLLAHNHAPDGFFWSSWQQRAGGAWALWKYQYAADQGDVYLGFRAGADLYNDASYATTATFLAANTTRAFFLVKAQRFGVGRESAAHIDTGLDGFNGIFAQGYLAWVFGDHAETRAAAAWLGARVRSDGSVRTSARGKAFTLSAAMLIFADTHTGLPQHASTTQWLTTVPFDVSDGGVRDTNKINSAKYSNVAAFSLIALLGIAP